MTTENNEIFEKHKNDIIVYSTTDSFTSFGIKEVICKGHLCNGTSHDGKIFTTVFSDNISVKYGTEYFLNLAKALSYTTGTETYARVEDTNYKVTSEGIEEISEIPFPVARKLPNMKGPAGGWAGATRESLYRSVKNCGNEAIYDYLKYFAKKNRGSEIRNVARKMLKEKNIEF